MTSFSKVFTSLTGFGFVYLRDTRHAAHSFGQENITLDRNDPKFGFEYYVTINLSSLGAQLLHEYDLTHSDFTQVYPLVKQVDMPSMSIETDSLNEYNRHRISQKRLNFEPIKMVIHDVNDGKTLKFWQLYYEFYFKDGLRDAEREEESGEPKSSMDNLPNPVKFTDKFGYKLSQIDDRRQLIDSIEIAQVHASKFSLVKLVNPRFSSFNHDTLAYDKNDILELTFTIEYEYAEYSRQREKISNGNLDRYAFGEFMDLPSLAISGFIGETLGKINPLLKSDNPILRRVGKNVQSAATDAASTAISTTAKKGSASVLDGMASVDPPPVNPTPSPPVAARTFKVVPRTRTLGGSEFIDTDRVKL